MVRQIASVLRPAPQVTAIKGGGFFSTPSTERTVVIIAGTAVGLFALWQGWQAYQRYQASRQGAQTVSDARNNLKNALKTQVLSYPSETYSGWAGTIFNLLDGSCGVGKNDAQVLFILNKLKNEADWLNLVSVFGTKTVGNCTFGSYTGDLPTVLNKGMMVMSINGINNEYFPRKGITSRI